MLQGVTNMINKDTLIGLQIDTELLQAKKEELASIQDVFNAENRDLIDEIQSLGEDISESRGEITCLVIDEYNNDKTQRKFLGGMSVKVGVKLKYDEDLALGWAKESMPVIIKETIDKKIFDKFAKDNKLAFVTKEEKVTVCFPSKGIKFAEDD